MIAALPLFHETRAPQCERSIRNLACSNADQNIHNVFGRETGDGCRTDVLDVRVRNDSQYLRSRPLEPGTPDRSVAIHEFDPLLAHHRAIGHLDSRVWDRAEVEDIVSRISPLVSKS